MFIESGRMSAPEIAVMHLTKTHLDNNENWIWNQLMHTPQCHSLVASMRFLPTYPRSARVAPLVDSSASAAERRPAISPGDRGVYAGFGDYLSSLSSARANVLHAHFIDTAWYFLPLADRAGLPLVVSAYGADLTYLPVHLPYWRDRYKEVFDRAALILVQGPAGVGRVVSWGADPARVRVIPLGIPSRRVQKGPRTRSAIFQVLQVAHYREKKGHEDTLRAFSLAFGNSGEGRLSFIGDKPLSRDSGVLGRLYSEVERLKLSEVVEFMPQVPYRMLGALLRNADAYCQPSKTTEQGDVEGGPLAVLEAQAQGVPVLSTRHENIPFLVADTESGFLVAEGDVDALAERMRALAVMDAADYRRHSESALRVAARHTSEIAGRQLLLAYRSVLG
jgi:colanic acid/amylovoran/stewartan biosynthesis glycosyltransferase WcaL/AmsK/CpsK